MSEPVNKESSRFKWSHHHPLHRTLVKLFNRVMRYVPFSLKYSIGQRRRIKRYPYVIISEGDTVVQVGAPIDTLGSARARAMHFALKVRNSGKAVIIEPDSASKLAYESHKAKWGLSQICFVHLGAWSEKSVLSFYIDPKHPATNFTGGVREYSEKDMRAYSKVELEADSIDNILSNLKINDVSLVSITTNGAEPEILKGLTETMQNGLPYICLARTGEKYIDLMKGYGYGLFAHDDRGYTFKQIKESQK